MRVLFILAILTSALAPRQSLAHENQSLPRDQANKSSDQVKGTDPVPPRQIGDGVTHSGTTPEQRNETYKYEHQAANKKFVWIPIIINAIYVVVSGFTLYFIGKQAKHMNRSVELSGKQLELSERPWVAADVTVASPLTFNASMGVLTF